MLFLIDRDEPRRRQDLKKSKREERGREELEPKAVGKKLVTSAI